MVLPALRLAGNNVPSSGSGVAAHDVNNCGFQLLAYWVAIAKAMWPGRFSVPHTWDDVARGN
jgi:hypothetical protein